MEKSLIIIGGGLAGLAAGCYGRMNGYRTSIFEMHNMAGGVCTGWKRKGYIIDGAMNTLTGTRPGTSFYRFWEELGAAQHWDICYHDQYILLENGEGKIFTMYCDIDRLEREMMEFAPEDEGVIREVCKAIRDCKSVAMPVDKPQELYNVFDYIKMLKQIPTLRLMQK